MHSTINSHNGASPVFCQIGSKNLISVKKYKKQRHRHAVLHIRKRHAWGRRPRDVDAADACGNDDGDVYDDVDGGKDDDVDDNDDDDDGVVGDDEVGGDDDVGGVGADDDVHFICHVYDERKEVKTKYMSLTKGREKILYLWTFNTREQHFLCINKSHIVIRIK